MSAFLGRIHYWLYNKILLHEDLLKDIIALAEAKGVPVKEIEERVYSQFGYPDYSPLEDVIDHGNIHGWLQSRIQSVEYRIAAIVTELIDNYNIALDDLKVIYKNSGIKAQRSLEEKASSPEEIFKRIYDFLLEGMPCDRVNEVIESTEDSFVWETTSCLHKPYWDAVGGNVNHFYVLQEAFISSFVKAEDNNFRYIQGEDGVKAIRKG